MIFLLLFLALIIIATNNLAPQLAEAFGFGAWNMIGPDTNRRGFEIASESSGDGAIGDGAGAHLRQYPHYSLTD